MHASPPTASAPRIALLRVARGEPSSSCAARKVKEPAAKPLSSDSTSAAPWRPWEEVGRGSECEEEVGRGGEWEEEVGRGGEREEEVGRGGEWEEEVGRGGEWEE